MVLSERQRFLDAAADVEHDLTGQPSLPDELENLRRTGEALVVASGVQQGAVDLLQNEGLASGTHRLSPLLAGLLELAEDFLHNPAAADLLEDGLGRLKELLTRSQACPEPVDEQEAEDFVEALPRPG